MSKNKIRIRISNSSIPKHVINILQVLRVYPNGLRMMLILEEKFFIFWDGVEEKAELVTSRNNQFVKFKWQEHEDDSYFEIRIVVDELTKDVSLIITDFSDEDEVEESKMLWESQIADLKQVLGSS